MKGHSDCVKFLRSKHIPLVLLGGGGYTVRNVACSWTYETACAIGIENDLDLNIPYNEYLEWYGPRYKLEIRPSNITNDNQTKNYLEKTKCVPNLFASAESYLSFHRQEALAHLHDLPFAPSLGHHAVPRQSVAKELGLVDGNDEEKEDPDLDAEIRRAPHAFQTLS
jgi:histone deacetylase 1/2